MSDAQPSRPPGQRRAVVLREGPPRGRGRTLDGVLGAVGGVLLLLAVLLVNVLPEETVPDPQFRVEYGDELVEIIGSRQSADLPGAPADGIIGPGRDDGLRSDYEVEHNNVFEVSVEVFFEDDFPESLPDVLRWELFYPNGTSAGLSSEYETLPTAEAEAGAGPEVGGVSYVTVGSGTYKATFNLGGKPEDQIVTFQDGRNGTLEEATQAIVLAQTRATQGTWGVQVWLESVGPCPSAGTAPESIRHAQICRFAAQQREDGDDVGNGFVLSKFEYRYYTIQVSEV